MKNRHMEGVTGVLERLPDVGQELMDAGFGLVALRTWSWCVRIAGRVDAGCCCPPQHPKLPREFLSGHHAKVEIITPGRQQSLDQQLRAQYGTIAAGSNSSSGRGSSTDCLSRGMIPVQAHPPEW